MQAEPTNQPETMRTEDMSEEENESLKKSALQDNIERKGKNAYYFAHSHKATGPAWDGKAEPRLLSSTSSSSPSAVDSSNALHRSASSTFDYARSNITSYAFLDEPSKVKLYIELPNIGEQCKDEDIVLEYTEKSFSLTVQNYQNPEEAKSSSSPPCLCFARLAGSISAASVKRKENRLILTLVKTDPDVTWHTINDKGKPDHEVV